MKTRSLVSAHWLLPLLLAAACSGTRLNDVGDVNGEGGEGPGGTSSFGGTTSVGGEPSSGGTGPTGGTGLTFGGSSIGGAPDTPPLTGEAGGPSYEGELDCSTCEEIAETPDIRALWLTTERMYWTEFGSSDALDNHQGDGRLMSMSLSGGSPVEVATGLQGPTWLALGESYAYVWLDRSSAPQGAKQLARISLDTGDVEVVRPYREGTWVGDDLARRAFAFAGGYAHWWEAGPATSDPDGTVFRLAEDATSPPEEVATADEFLRLSADENSLYLHDYEGIQAFPLAGGPAQQLITTSVVYDPMVIVGNDFFGVELGSPSYTVKLPLAGGKVKRLGKNSNRYVPGRIVTDGSRFIGSSRTLLTPEVAAATLVDGELADSGAAVTLAVVPSWRSDEGGYTFPTIRAWDANATDAYLGYEGKLYRIPRPE